MNVRIVDSEICRRWSKVHNYTCYSYVLMHTMHGKINHSMHACMQATRQISQSNAKQKHPGCKKSARPIRSSIANRYVRPKTLISFEAKKLLIKNLFNYVLE